MMVFFGRKFVGEAVKGGDDAVMNFLTPAFCAASTTLKVPSHITSCASRGFSRAGGCAQRRHMEITASMPRLIAFIDDTPEKQGTSPLATRYWERGSQRFPGRAPYSLYREGLFRIWGEPPLSAGSRLTPAASASGFILLRAFRVMRELDSMS